MVIEAVYHSEGRVAYTAGANPRYEYSIKDHPRDFGVGAPKSSTRLTFCDLNSDGAIQTPSEILQENHYYPFGLAMNGPWMNNPAPDNLYQYNGKELQPDHGLGWYDYGARMYMPDLGRWNGVDALAEKYVNISTYAYTANNPILFIDPNGMSISNYYAEGSILNDFTPEAERENLKETMERYDRLRVAKKLLSSNESVAARIGASGEVSYADAVGYNIEGSVNGNFGIFSGSGRVGISRVVFTGGDYAGVPREYLYWGGSLTINLNFASTKTVNFAIGDIISADANATFSPFLAFFGGTDSELTPETWLGAFGSASFSIKAKAGIGFSGGVSVFSSTTTGIFEYANKGWRGFSGDIGFGVGTPNAGLSPIYFSNYIFAPGQESWKNIKTNDLSSGFVTLQWLRFLNLW
jgi:RHS repeat-associated protein